MSIFDQIREILFAPPSDFLTRSIELGKIGHLDFEFDPEEADDDI